MQSKSPTVPYVRELRIPLRDGVHLCGALYTTAAEPLPAIVAMTPYTTDVQHNRGVLFAEHGFAFVAVDVRGRGNSGGEFTPEIQEAQDGYDVIEWISMQSWCTGKVLMCGGSYSGYAQWAAAKLQPPGLTTIAPSAAPFIGLDVPMRRNIASTYLVRWLSLVRGRAMQMRAFADEAYWTSLSRDWFKSGAPFSALAIHAGDRSTTFQQYLDHPCPDEFLDHFNPSDDEYAEISLPVLTITGAYDGDQLGALEHYRRHTKFSSSASSNHYLVIGPWDHAGTAAPNKMVGGVDFGEESVINIEQLLVDWYRWTLGTGPKPELLKQQVSYFIAGTGKWAHARSLNEVTKVHQRLFITSNGPANDLYHSGQLTEAIPPSDSVSSYRHDPTDITLADIDAEVGHSSLTDQRLVARMATRHLVYHSAPFKKSKQVSGFFKATLWMSIDTPDTDFRVTIYEVEPSGTAILLTDDLLRARYRISDRKPELIHTDKPLLYEFDQFTFVSRLVSAGSRIRLVIAPLVSIFHERNNNTGGVVAEESIELARTVTVRLYSTAACRSAIEIPIGEAGDEAL